MNRPLATPILSFIAGIIASSLYLKYLTPVSVPVIVAVLVILLLVAIACFKNTKLFYTFLCLFFFLLGTFRYTTSIVPEGDDISYFLTETPRKALLSGSVMSSPEWKGGAYSRRLAVTLRAEKLLLEDKEYPVTGKVRVNIFSPGERPRIGDRLVIGGKISLPRGKTNPAGFDYKSYLSHLGIRAVMSSSKNDYLMIAGTKNGPGISFLRTLSKLRERSEGILDRYLSGTTKAITKATILGMRGDVKDSTKDAFSKTGTMHILAVSGLHVGIVAMLAVGLLRLLRCSRNITYLLAILIIFAFAVFTGCRPSSMRAAIMGAFVLIGLLMGRKTDVVNSLIVSAFLITFFYPGQLFLQGFILSYLAVLCIIYIVPLTDIVFGIKPRHLRETAGAATKRYTLKAISVSCAIWLGMMPVIASNFYIIAPSVILTNLLAIPALFVIVILGFTLLLTGFVPFLASAGIFVSWILSAIIPFFINILEAISRIPFSFFRVSSPGPALIAIFYIILTALIIFSKQAKKQKIIILAFLFFTANLFVWNEINQKPPNALSVTFFDVGRADASLLEFSDGSTMLIDGGTGGEGSSMDVGRNTLAPYLWQRGIRKIDCILLTHPHSDHMGGLFYILKNFKIGTAIEGCDVAEDNPARELYNRYQNIIEAENINKVIVKRGDVIKGLPDTDFAVLNPPVEFSYGDLNNDSVVVKTVTTENNGIIFCADIEAPAIRDILQFGSFLKADIIKIPHHGQGLGDVYAVNKFIAMTNSQNAVITNRNIDKLDKELLKDIHKIGAKVHITGFSGAAIAEEEGRSFTLRNFLKEE
ncbi:DNA internalization-related competence protein ComEC/Rec2 [Candidatus Omnitrophota bacterium]